MRILFAALLISAVALADSSTGRRLPAGTIILDGYSPWYLAVHGGAIFFQGGDAHLYRAEPGKPPRRLPNDLAGDAFSADDQYLYGNDAEGVWRVSWRQPQAPQLVTRLTGPVAVDDDHLYVATKGALLVFPKRGGAARSLPAPIGADCSGLAAGERWLFASEGTTLVAIPKDGGAPRQIATRDVEWISAVAADRHHVYFLADDDWIWRMPQDQSTPPARWLQPPFPDDARPPKSLAADERGVYTSFFEERNPGYEGEGDCRSQWIDVDGAIARLPR